MKLKIEEHKNGLKVIPTYIEEEVKAAITESRHLNKASTARASILKNLRDNHGWSGTAKLSPDAKITITSRKGKYGLCVQTGNMARFYADLLKLEYLYKEGIVDAAVFVVPTKELAEAWGSNICHSKRLANELKIFSKIISIPMLIIGIPAS